MMRFFLCFFLTVGFALLAHRMDAGIPLRRGLRAVSEGFPALLSATLFLLICVLFGRPVLSLTLVAGATLGIWGLNRIKLGLYQEPLNFMDLFLIPGIIRHPHFYTPYILPVRAVVGVVAVAVILTLLFYLEPPLSGGIRLAAGVLCLGGAAVCFFLGRLFTAFNRARAMRLLRHASLRLGPAADWHRLGLLASLFLQGLWHRHARARDGAPGIARDPEKLPRSIVWGQESLAPVGSAGPVLPHLALIQAESFFDLRRLSPEIDPGLLQHYDAAAEQGLSGELTVPAHGAYTMRTEFSVLSGTRMDTLGTDGFNPYLTPARQPAWSLARHLKKRGYHTVCVHPFSMAFFGRNKVMPNLGFDTLIDETSFADADRFGPYVSDAALGSRILQLALGSSQPLFIFAITMEAHGPWAPGRLGAVEKETDFPSMPSWGDEELGLYLTHIRNTDRMLGMLTKNLPQAPNGAVLGLYGDHVGNIPRAFSRTRYMNQNTDYLVWKTDAPPPATRKNLYAEQLGGLLLTSLRDAGQGVPQNG